MGVFSCPALAFHYTVDPTPGGTMTEPATVAKVKIKKVPDLVQDDSLRGLFVQSLKEYCDENEIELEKAGTEVIVKELLEVSGQVIKNTVDAFVDCYMLNIAEGEEDEDSGSESQDSE